MPGLTDPGIRAVAHSYLSLAGHLDGAPSGVATFEHAVAHHRLLEAIERSGREGVRVEC